MRGLGAASRLRHLEGAVREVGGGVALPFLAGTAGFFIVIGEDVELAGTRSVDGFLIGGGSWAGGARSTCDICSRRFANTSPKANNGTGPRGRVGAPMGDKELVDVATLVAGTLRSKRSCNDYTGRRSSWGSRDDRDGGSTRTRCRRTPMRNESAFARGSVVVQIGVGRAAISVEEDGDQHLLC